MGNEATRIGIEVIRSVEHGWYRAYVRGIPAYGDGETEEEALADLRNSLTGNVEAFGVDDMLARIWS